MKRFRPLRLLFSFLFLQFLFLCSGTPASLAPPQPEASRVDRYRALLKMISRKEYAPAAAECRALIERYPEFSQPFSQLVIIARASAQIPQTEAYLRTLATTNPRAWYALGLLADEADKYEEAFASQQKCLEALPNFPLAASKLAQIAVILKAPTRAEALFKTRPNEPACLYGLGILMRAQRQLQPALEWHERALQLQPRLLEAMTEKASLLSALGRLTEAVVVYDAALSLITEHDDPEQYRLWMDSKGRVHFQLAQYPQAIRAEREVIRITREFEWRDYEERAHSFVASSKFQMNYFSEALQDFQQALTLSRQGNRRFLSRYLGNIGLTYRNLGDLTRSAEYFQQAIDAGRGGTDPESVRTFLINLSELYLENGEPHKAQPLLEEAARIVNETRDNWPQYLIHAGWARYHYFTRDYRAALNAQQSALPIVEQLGKVLQQGTSLILMGDCYLELQDRAAAASAYQKALAVGQKIQVLSVIWRAEAGLARLAQDAQPQEALQHYRRAIDAIEKIRTRQTSSEEKTGYFQEATDVYQKAVALLLQLHRRDPKQGHSAEAFHLAERIRARALLDSLMETTEYLEQKLEPDLLERQHDIQRRLSAAEAQLQQVVANAKTTPDTIRKLEAELLRAVNDYSDWRKQVRQRNPYLAELTLPEPLTLEQTQAALK